MFQTFQSNLWDQEDQHLLRFCEVQHQLLSQKNNQNLIPIDNLNINNVLLNYIKDQIPQSQLSNLNLINQKFFQFLNYKLQINVQSKPNQNLAHTTSYFTNSSYFSNINDLLMHFRFFIQHFLIINKGNNQFSIYVPFYSVFFISDRVPKLSGVITLNNSHLEEIFFQQQNSQKNISDLTQPFTSQKFWISNFNYQFLQQNHTKYVNLKEFTYLLTDKQNLFNTYQQIISDILDIYQKQILVYFDFQFKYLVCKKTDLKKFLFPARSFQAIYLQADYIHEQSILVYKLGLIDTFDKTFIFQNKTYIFLIELYNNLTSNTNLQSILEYIEPYIFKLQYYSSSQSSNGCSPYPNFSQFYVKDIITQHDFFRFLLYYIFTLNYSALQTKEFEIDCNRYLQSDINYLKNKIYKDRDLIKNSSLQSLQSFLSSSQV